MSQQASKAYRHIAPKEDGRESTPPNTAAGALLVDDSRNRRASAACGECQRRRTRCIPEGTGNPCTECRIHGRECVVNLSTDKRRKAAARQTEELLKLYRGLVEAMLGSLRIEDPKITQEVLAHVRTKLPLPRLLKHLLEYVDVPSRDEVKVKVRLGLRTRRRMPARMGARMRMRMRTRMMMRRGRG
ncbi:Zn(II)2Cys6 transcription factor domain-containing protein [Aspergillus homomorphus CBS 101889]|uniref:Zn(2)-C6 fungal-type domain-containing protein n=1 Tax=Aspergillus homomorphus (strain CBS 101889) TaxID=1450537 RepID=A0A395IBE3_ASPHC|nr:hypothetical protein BO97DRAFT_4055 [Aspergillus homomorphus CBS 101889]RAL17285.1 hypothetical protein BO97DRAFT_4055 [Aspergillus homomorphus CBS 101889]